jgi:hypothetical protein
MINNESHFSDNGNGSMGFSTGQYSAMLLWSIDWNVQTMNAKSAKRHRKGNPIGGNVRKINSPNSPSP